MLFRIYLYNEYISNRKLNHRFTNESLNDKETLECL